MSILQLDIPEARVLDLYAGSGALGLEALSRGAVSADFVETNAKSLRALEENIAALGADDLSTIHRRPALAFIESLDAFAYDVVFADPPYSTGDAEKLALHWMATHFSSVMSVEHEAKTAMPPGGDTRKYGTTAITFYRSED